MNHMLSKTLLFTALVQVSTLVFPGVDALAGKYDRLKSDGYKTSSLTRNAAGIHGWVLKKGTKRQFCRLNASLVILNSKTLIGFTSSGRQIRASRKAYESRAGSVENKFPKMSDVKRGTVESRFVGSCTRMR